MRRYLCGTPKAECCGAIIQTNFSLKDKTHGHPDQESAWNCYTTWLLKQGYVQVGNREFQRGDEPILVLNKKCRFAAELRKGKSGEKSMSGGNRFMPRKLGKITRAGLIM